MARIPLDLAGGRADAGLADPEVRRRLNEAGNLRGLAKWERLIIVETFAPESDHRCMSETARRYDEHR